MCTSTKFPQQSATSRPVDAAILHKLGLLLLRGLGLLLQVGLLHHRHDLSQHYHTISVHEGHAGETLAILESVTHQRLLRSHDDLGHLVRLQAVGILHLLATGLLAHLPLQTSDTASRPTAAHKADRRVAALDLTGNVQNLDLSVELTTLSQARVLLVDHHITRAGHVLLVQTLNVQAHVIAWLSAVSALVVHLDGEHLTEAWIGRGVRRHENHLFVGLHHTLLHAACEHVTHTLDLVDSGDRHAHGGVARALRNAADLVQEVVHGVHMDFLAALSIHVVTCPPSHLIRLLQQIVAHPARDGHDGSGLLDEVLLPAD